MGIEGSLDIRWLSISCVRENMGCGCTRREEEGVCLLCVKFTSFLISRRGWYDMQPFWEWSKASTSFLSVRSRHHRAAFHR
jgi:hypothetical protein